MNNPIIIERSDLLELMDVQADKAAARAAKLVLEGLGLKSKDIDPWITQHAAWKLVKRTRLSKAMKDGTVEFKKADITRPHSRVFIRRKDLDKIIRNPML